MSKATTLVNLRNGPSTSYYSKGLLKKGTRFDPSCSKNNHKWFYGKVLSGAHAGTWGWVYGAYLRVR
ncbi:SH3 domain-containing protein [Streptomyces sp. NPDC046862]|uniref:SH3 domain-containing protein n=1 Tax=Streptomyces sp. NPDC046862 TaxID=3154603 RepID=UPI00345231B4